MICEKKASPPRYAHKPCTYPCTTLYMTLQTPLDQFSKLGCSTTKRVAIRNDTSSESPQRDVCNADLFGTDTAPTAVEVSTMENRSRGTWYVIYTVLYGTTWLQKNSINSVNHSITDADVQTTPTLIRCIVRSILPQSTTGYRYTSIAVQSRRSGQGRIAGKGVLLPATANRHRLAEGSAKYLVQQKQQQY